MRLYEFAPDEGGESRKFIPWNEFVDQLKQILHKDFDCKESINMDVIKAKFVPYDPMEYGPTQIYSYFERRAGRKGANSVRGQIQVGKFIQGNSGLMTGYHLLKGTAFERYFDLTFDNLYKIANIIKGNTEGALQSQPQSQLDEFAPGDGSGGEDPSFNPETFYDIPKLKSVYKRLASQSVNWGWYDLQLKTLIRYMEEVYMITDDDLDEMFPTAPEISYYIIRNIIKAYPSNDPPYIIKNPNYKPRAPRVPKQGPAQ